MVGTSRFVSGSPGTEWLFFLPHLELQRSLKGKCAIGTMGEEKSIGPSGVERRPNACGETKGQEMEHRVPQGVRETLAGSGLCKAFQALP